MFSLNIIQLAKSFGTTTVFSDVSFSHRQNTLGIGGSNGSGKSTFLKCLGNLLRPSRGRIEWKQDEESLDRQHLKRKMGYAAPYINLYNELSCRENLAFLAKVRHEPDAQSAIDHWIPKVGLAHVADHPFGKLSTGQQQRLRLAAALFHQPSILLLDEPGSNLDKSGHELIAEIADAFQDPGKLLVIASNNAEELALCDRVFSIEQTTFA